MKILWVKIDFLHPTNRGGQIRTLETLRRLHRRHEVHFVAYHDPAHPEALQRASEYCSRAYAVPYEIPDRNTPRFFLQLLRNLASPLPLAVGRYQTELMRRQIRALLDRENFDCSVCDFLSSAPNFPTLANTVLFQHNIETAIWQRHAQHAPTPLHRAYFRVQAKRMFRAERQACRDARHVIAVSAADASSMRELFSVQNVTAVPTGVDVDFFRAPVNAPKSSDIVFLGAMDWLPNIDGARYFVSEILPRIRRERPKTRVTFAGRAPVPEILAMAASDPLLKVTGTIPDVRPYLWESLVSIVPLRIGGGTRLKIYEAMAAGVPVVSTSIGAEGLDVSSGLSICLADSPDVFAADCVRLLESSESRSALSSAALELVTSRFSWETVTSEFERVLLNSRA